MNKINLKDRQTYLLLGILASFTIFFMMKYMATNLLGIMLLGSWWALFLLLLVRERQKQLYTGVIYVKQ
jgi:hypothetical protein